MSTSIVVICLPVSPGWEILLQRPVLRPRSSQSCLWAEPSVNIWNEVFTNTRDLGMTSIMSEMKVCLKMAVEAGTGIVLPTIPLRDSTDLKEFNVDHPEAFFPYNQWFDEKHLRDGLARACPHMKVLNPDSLDKDQADRIMVKNNWEMDVTKAPGYHFFASHFWVGNPFSTFFDDEFKRLQRESDSGSGEGITVIKIACIFLLFRITDDPTGGDLLLWNDLAMLMRFLEKPRKIVHNLLAQLNRPFYGVHFRVENDTVWGSLESQLSLDLDALDKAWSMYKHDNGLGSQKPIVYVACGDEGQMKAFIEGGKFRGWDVTHKWDLARQISNPETVKMIDGLAFDFQGAVDMGMMIQSHFFIGISGSAMSNTIAHARDVTGRYRGSSLREKIDDGGARSYLVHDGQASSYPCCL